MLGGFVFKNCSRTKCCSHLAISQRWDSGTAGSRSPANRPTRVRGGAGGAYFPDKIETHKYVFVSVLCCVLVLPKGWTQFVESFLLGADGVTTCDVEGGEG